MIQTYSCLKDVEGDGAKYMNYECGQNPNIHILLYQALSVAFMALVNVPGRTHRYPEIPRRTQTIYEMYSLQRNIHR